MWVFYLYWELILCNLKSYSIMFIANEKLIQGQSIREWSFSSFVSFLCLLKANMKMKTVAPKSHIDFEYLSSAQYLLSKQRRWSLIRKNPSQAKTYVCSVDLQEDASMYLYYRKESWQSNLISNQILISNKPALIWMNARTHWILV